MRTSSTSVVPAVVPALFLLAAVASLNGCTASTSTAASLSYEGCSGDGCSTALDSHAVVVGGTTTIVNAGSGTIAKATSSNPSVVRVGAISSGIFGGSEVAVTGVSPGSATLSVFDASGALLTSATVNVADVTDVALDPGVPATGVTVIPGRFEVHSTTIGAGGVTLAGEGAIHFALSGILEGDNSASACEGDCVGFSVTDPGVGDVSIRAAGASRTLPVHAIDVSTLDAFAFVDAAVTLAATASATPAYRLSSVGTLVYGYATSCTLDDPTIAQVVPPLFGQVTGFAGGVSGAAWLVGSKPGTTTLRCSIGALTTAVPVTVTAAPAK